MGKKKDKKKAAPEVTIDTSVELSKKERKALKEREAVLEAKLAEKAAKKKGKKGAKRSAATEEPDVPTAEERKAKSPGPGVAGSETHTPAQIIAAADAVLADPNAAEDARSSAVKAKGKALAGMSPEDLKARVEEKRAKRDELEAQAATIDRDDAAAVKAYNDALAAAGGTHFITSSEELDTEARRLKGGDDGRTEETEVRKARKAKKGELVVEFSDGETLAEPEQVVTPVETETGTVYTAGAVGDPSVPESLRLPGEKVDNESTFAKPSEAPRTDFETNGLNQYKIKRKVDGKVVGFTRATTYIANLEDSSGLTKWKLRLLAEGIAVNDTDPELGADSLMVATLTDLVHRRDVTIAKARKADKKGKLAVGELGQTVEQAWRDYKKAVDALVDQALDVAGVKDKANKGTDIHALCELAVREGIDAVGDKLTEGEITPADLVDVEAFLKATSDAGVRFIPELVEQVVANDELKVAGRMDYGVLFRFPGTSRAVRCVMDLKTGRIDLGAGKIAQQVELYASSEGYDLNTHERSDMKLSRTKGLVVHLPAGTGKATVHVVDLSLGRRGNALSGQVRAWRNEGKKAIDVSVDLATVVSEA